MNLLILLATLAQCPPGQSCPAPAYAVRWVAPQVVWSWHDVILDGRRQRVWGYPVSGGMICYALASAAPPGPPVTPAPHVPAVEPAPAPAPEKPAEPAPEVIPIMADDVQNFGLDMAHLEDQVETIQTNDPMFGATLGLGPGLPVQTVAVEGRRPEMLDPTFNVAIPDLTVPTAILTGGLVLCAALLSRRRS